MYGSRKTNTVQPRKFLYAGAVVKVLASADESGGSAL